MNVQRENEAGKEGVLENLDTMKAPEEGDVTASTWKVNDMRVFVIVSKMISTNGAHGEVDCKSVGHTKDLLHMKVNTQFVQLRRQHHEF